jgi:hypothetical protein
MATTARLMQRFKGNIHRVNAATLLGNRLWYRSIHAKKIIQMPAKV